MSQPEQYTNVITPKPVWPPPVYESRSASLREKHYIKHRWYAQWRRFDKLSFQSKKNYARTQNVVAILSVSLPIIVTINSQVEPWETIWFLAAIMISFTIALFTAFETFFGEGTSAQTYKSGADALQREKFLYDARLQHYPKDDDNKAFSTFVTKCEDIIKAVESGKGDNNQADNDSGVVEIASST